MIAVAANTRNFESATAPLNSAKTAVIQMARTNRTAAIFMRRACRS